MRTTFFLSVCRNVSYRTVVLEMFPNIKVLDGEFFLYLSPVKDSHSNNDKYVPGF